ncbi:MAG: methylated-DNA--[protein]-cysteine S-methyltransferase [Candidatus Cloacimonetes bacterium]|nr:methylated-DNA--[protein]-cysteine S-methyltransferase [Candidatus Cloacimonadota bacterium]
MIFSTNPIIEKAKRQLIEYFKGTRRNFALPVKPEGTEFQQKVWHLLMDIPYGDTLTYQELAERAGNSKASRAVGIANSKNPISIIIPCHRVVRKNGESGGYAGGVVNKKYLLRLESR